MHQAMRVYRSTDEISYRKDSVITLGTFDGIHVGHRRIIGDLVRRAKEMDARSVLITFYPHPQTVVQTHADPIGLLTPLDEKVALLEATGLDAVLVLTFTQEFGRMEPEDFVERVLVDSVGISEFIIGYNHAFGRERKGDAAFLERLGAKHDFTVDVVPPVLIDGGAVSSTRIRRRLSEGRVVETNRLLGRPYTVDGVVRKGRGLGGKIGFPTANLEVLGEHKLVPRDGVYAVMVELDGKRLSGMANLGCRPTVEGNCHAIEVHIHDFSNILYDQRIRLVFIERIRDEKKFDSVETLVSQMKEDRKQSMALLSRKNRR